MMFLITCICFHLRESESSAEGELRVRYSHPLVSSTAALVASVLFPAVAESVADLQRFLTRGLGQSRRRHHGSQVVPDGAVPGHHFPSPCCTPHVGGEARPRDPSNHP
ncbi:hypothetical protein E2C01_023023 [Portunus trituberculatus]|uniref:Uncharacterized protein n=1 Tax=Portunus trituberculatus TaxID=210409 RepID=A0A5B7E8U8_PORTR|nr:hypothetical protein [Portunus trituberculatus]